MPVAPQRVRTQSSCQYILMLLGSTRVKAVQRTLMKLSPGVNFINFLQAAFMHADPKSTKNTVKLPVFFALSGSVCAKAARRMLMKLPPDWIQRA
jgi:hypothetical protein